MPTKKTVTKKVTLKKVATKAPKKVVKKTTKKVAQKTATKKVAKKVAKKNPVSKTRSQTNKKTLVVASNSTSFWVTDGSVLNSLVSLRDILDTMDKKVYSYHTDKPQNDFTNWIAAVLGDEACAVDLEKAKTPKAAKTTITRHLKLYNI